PPLTREKPGVDRKAAESRLRALLRRAGFTQSTVDDILGQQSRNGRRQRNVRRQVHTDQARPQLACQHTRPCHASLTSIAVIDMHYDRPDIDHCPLVVSDPLYRLIENLLEQHTIQKLDPTADNVDETFSLEPRQKPADGLQLEPEVAPDLLARHAQHKFRWGVASRLITV